MVLPARSHDDEFLSRKCEKKLLFLASLCRAFLQVLDLSRVVCRFFRCPVVAGNHLRYFTDPTGSNTITILTADVFQNFIENH